MAPSPVESADGGGISSPTTPPPQSSFRELDDAFLQNQTRIWLGEVLSMRFDKDMNISDLLADGQILFEVYKVLRKMLLSEDHSNHQKFLERESVSSSEITEIFPYAKVECFLEVCQRLGLSDIDLFTTSDVVDKRNTRKVCMCLRFLSKKARSGNLNVPDFDSVTVTHRKKSPVNMPTDMVGNRLRNLERASSSPVQVSDDMRRGSRRSQQGEFVGFHADSSAYKSDDDCESDSVVGDSLGGSTDSSANSTSPRTPDPSTVGDFGFVQCELEQLKIEGPDGDENAETTSPSQDLGSGLGDNFQLIDHQSIHDHEDNLPSHSPIPVDWQALEEESEGNNAVKSDDITGSSLHSLIDVSSAITADNETESDGDDCCSHIQLADGENADLPSNEIHNLCKELEVVSTNDVKAIGSPLPVAVDMDNFAVSSPSHETGEDSHIAVGSAETTQQGVNLSFENCRDIPCIEDMEEMKNPSNPHCGKGEVVSNGGFENCDKAISKCHLGENDPPIIEDADKSQIAKGEIEDLKDENKKIDQQCKPPRKMLKLIAGGTGTVAAVGVMLYWLQLRKKGTENAAAQKFSLPNPTRIAATEKRSSSEKRERASTNKIYPANKLNFRS